MLRYAWAAKAENKSNESFHLNVRLCALSLSFIQPINLIVVTSPLRCYYLSSRKEWNYPEGFDLIWDR